MRGLTHLDLFSGIGGFALAARWAGVDTVAFCEIDDFATKVLRKNFPGVPVLPDIKELNGNEFKGVNIITGGYPCQPFSVAGAQRAQNDDRHLWPEMRRVIAQAEPDCVICENVYGHVRLGLDAVLFDLASLGYTAQPFVIPAVAAGANHRRDRVYIVAYAGGDGLYESTRTRCIGTPDDDRTQGADKSIYDEGRCGVRDTVGWGSCSSGAWGVEPPALRVDDGLPDRVDRIKSLGNAIVPQLAYKIFRGIAETVSR